MWQAALNKVFKVREKVALNLTPEDEEKPFLDHLEDLRKMFVRIAVTLIITVLCTFGFNKFLTDTILKPYVWAMNGASLSINGYIISPDELAEKKAEKETTKEGAPTSESAAASSDSAVNTPDLDSRPPFTWKMPGTRTPQEGFMASVNVSLVAAVIISFPFLLLFLLQFILPGLRTSERRILWPALGIGFGLFITGVVFSFFFVLPRALQFFVEWNYDHGFENIWMLGDYITFATRFILIFGVSFELPVVVMALVKLDFLSYKVMTGTRKHAIVGIAIFSAVITPTQDVLTLALLAVPLYFLYEICIWLAYFLEKKERQAYPEFYEERDKDEAELEKEVDDWDKEGYTPWFSDEEDEDIEDEYQQKAKTEDKKPADPTAPSASDDDETPVTPANSEKTLEELAREDEQSSPATTPTETPDEDSNGADPSRNQD